VKNIFVKRPATSGSTNASSIGFVLLLLSLAPACLSQQIKKKTELVFAKDKMAFEVAESKTNSGLGQSTGSSILKGIAAANGNPVPEPIDHTDDPNWDFNLDPTMPLTLSAGMRCYSRTGDKAIVLRVDGIRVLVEVNRPHYFYRGPQEGTALLAAVETGALVFKEIDNTPACLNKIKLWIDRDVFLALQSRPVATKAKGRAAEGDLLASGGSMTNPREF
jgi:hypothetical protein